MLGGLAEPKDTSMPIWDFAGLLNTDLCTSSLHGPNAGLHQDGQCAPWFRLVESDGRMMVDLRCDKN